MTDTIASSLSLSIIIGQLSIVDSDVILQPSIMRESIMKLGMLCDQRSKSPESSYSLTSINIPFHTPTCSFDTLQRV
jgi:hypothetical protein